MLPLIAALAACFSSGAGRATLGNPDVILRDEILESSARNAFELVQTARPQWLRLRGMTTLSQAAGEQDIVVYLDNARLGFRESMGQVSLAAVEYLQFFDARMATQRWGGGHLNGAILISTQSR
jgi:hypothetical protein